MTRFVTAHQYGVDPDSLGRLERALFTALARDTERVWTKAELMIALRPLGSTRALDSLAVRLRVQGIPLRNIWGVGYRLEEPPCGECGGTGRLTGGEPDSDFPHGSPDTPCDVCQPSEDPS